MLLSFFLATQVSIISFYARGQAIYGGEFSERTRQIIQNEVSLRAENRDQKGSRSAPMTLQDSYFRDSSGNWVDLSYTRYSDEKWSRFNCYSYAMQRYDIVPEYFPFYYDLPASRSRWYEPGQISSMDDPDHYLTAREQAEAVVNDFNVMGYLNVSTFRLGGTLPALGSDEELIAVRITNPLNSPYDYHFMRYNKSDGSWYHKPGSGDILKYKYALSEQLVWTNELPLADAGVTYSSDIWLIRYTPIVLSTSVGSELCEPIFVDNIGDKIIVLNVQEEGHLDLSFWNINGFSAVLYTDEWDSIGYASYNPINVDVSAGRYYLVMRNCRYWNYVYVSVFHSALREGALFGTNCRSFVVSENDRFIVGKVVDGGLSAIVVEPIAFISNEELSDMEVVN